MPRSSRPQSTLRSSTRRCIKTCSRANTTTRRCACRTRSFAARYNRGQFLQKHGELEAARSDYQVALEIKPDEASLYINLAAMELRLFETKLDIQLMAAAEKNLKQAERLRSKSPALYFNRARLFELYNFPARARTAYREAMRYYPETSVEYQTCQTRVQRLSMQLK
jgi:tetratricopeptide (TPR) repeat protein